MLLTTWIFCTIPKLHQYLLFIDMASSVIVVAEGSDVRKAMGCDLPQHLPHGLKDLHNRPGGFHYHSLHQCNVQQSAPSLGQPKLHHTSVHALCGGEQSTYRETDQDMLVHHPDYIKPCSINPRALRAKLNSP